MFHANNNYSSLKLSSFTLKTMMPKLRIYAQVYYQLSLLSCPQDGPKINTFLSQL